MVRNMFKLNFDSLLLTCSVLNKSPTVDLEEEFRYLRVYPYRSGQWSDSQIQFDNAKCGFYRPFNGIYGRSCEILLYS